MLGAIIGDVIGSRFEWDNVKSKQFDLFNPRCRFTDDSVLTIAVADAILNSKSYQDAILEYGKRYPGVGYGGRFKEWLRMDDPQPYNSWGNGSAMRVSPVGWAFNTEAEVMNAARLSAIVTHNHPEGVKGAQAVAMCIFLARNGKSKQEIKEYVELVFEYNLNERLDDIRFVYKFDVSCQGSVPESIIAFLESTDFEDAIRNAISIGGDSDTIACIAGAIAEAFYKDIPENIILETKKRLPSNFINILDKFARVRT